MYKTLLAVFMMAPCVVLASSEAKSSVMESAKTAVTAVMNKAESVMAAMPTLTLPAAIDKNKLILCGSASMPILSVALIKYLESGKPENEKLSPRTRSAIIFAGFLGSIAIAQFLPPLVANKVNEASAQ